MSLDYLISSLVADLIIDHRESKKQKQAMHKETLCSFPKATVTEIPCGSTNTSLDPEKAEVDVNWRERYRDNLADIDPENYDTLEDFLWSYEPIMEVIHKEYSKVVRSELAKLTEKYDLRFAAAIIYSGFKARLNKHNFACAMECLSKILQRNGVEMDTVISVAEQLDEAIRSYEKNPDTVQEFKISLL